MPPRFVFAPFWATEPELWAPLPLDGRRDSRERQQPAHLRAAEARRRPGRGAGRRRPRDRAARAAFPGTNRGVQVVAAEGEGRRPHAARPLGAARRRRLRPADRLRQRRAHAAGARAARGSRRSPCASRSARRGSRSSASCSSRACCSRGLGGVVGLALAAVGVRAVAAMAPPDLPRAADMAIEGWVLAFTLGVSIVTGLVFGLVPAWQAARTRIGDRLAARGTTGHGREALLRDVLRRLGAGARAGAADRRRADAAQPRRGVRASIPASIRAACSRCRCRCRARRRPSPAGAPRSSPRPSMPLRRAARRRGRERGQPRAARRRHLDARLRRRRPPRAAATTGRAPSTASCCPATSRRCGCRCCAAATSRPPTRDAPASRSSAKRSSAATSRRRSDRPAHHPRRSRPTPRRAG